MLAASATSADSSVPLRAGSPRRADDAADDALTEGDDHKATNSVRRCRWAFQGVPFSGHRARELDPDEDRPRTPRTSMSEVLPTRRHPAELRPGAMDAAVRQVVRCGHWRAARSHWVSMATRMMT